MSTAKHTPVPWHTTELAYPTPNIIRADKRCCDGPVRIATVYHSTSFSAANNAEFILRSCNSHYELLEACKAMLPLHESYQADVESPSFKGSRDFIARNRAAIESFKRAIAHAEPHAHLEAKE